MTAIRVISVPYVMGVCHFTAALRKNLQVAYKNNSCLCFFRADFRLNTVYGVKQLVNLKMGIDSVRYGVSCMSHDPLNDLVIHSGSGQERDTGMPGIMGVVM